MNERNHLGLVGGFVLVLTVGAGIWLGSQGLRHFDPAVTGYAMGTLLAAFAVGYRFVTWAQRPPSRMYFKRGLQLLFRRRAAAAAGDTQTPSFVEAAPQPHFTAAPGTLGHALATKFVTQGFI